MQNKKKVYIGFASSVLTQSHIRLFKKASKLGNLIIGLFTDRAILEFKSLPNVSFEERYNLLNSVKYINKIVIQDSYDYSFNLKKYKPDFVVHGNLWKGINGQIIKKKIINNLKKWGGKLIEVDYDYSTINIEKNLNKKLLDNPLNRVGKLVRLINNKKIVRFLECHDALSGNIIENLKVKKKIY